VTSNALVDAGVLLKAEHAIDATTQAELRKEALKSGTRKKLSRREYAVEIAWNCAKIPKKRSRS
jgi:hypothetical protein